MCLFFLWFLPFWCHFPTQFFMAAAEWAWRRNEEQEVCELPQSMVSLLESGCWNRSESQRQMCSTDPHIWTLTEIKQWVIQRVNRANTNSSRPIPSSDKRGGDSAAAAFPGSSDSRNVMIPASVPVTLLSSGAVGQRDKSCLLRKIWMEWKKDDMMETETERWSSSMWMEEVFQVVPLWICWFGVRCFWCWWGRTVGYVTVSLSYHLSGTWFLTRKKSFREFFLM